MSDQQEQIEGDQEDEDEQQDQEDDQDEDEDQDGSGDEDQDQNQDQDQDEDEQGDQDQQNQDDEESQQNQNQSQDKQVPSFKPISQQFAFKNLLADIASIGNSVDHFINTLPSRGGSAYCSYQPRIQYDTIKPRVYDIPPPQQQRKYTIMKDQDVQVSMQPQIVIQQTLTPKQQPKKQPYRISNESTKFLAQLYQENKKLKRWQNTQTASQNNTWYKSKQKFQRPEHERGLINLQDRNKQIDQAIQMLRRQDNY